MDFRSTPFPFGFNWSGNNSVAEETSICVPVEELVSEKHIL